MRSIVQAGTVALLLTLGQSNGQPFAGKWTCEYFGRTLARLELQDTGGVLTGRISIGVFHVDSEGKLDIVIEEATHYTPIFDVNIHDGVLSFAREEEDDNHRVETHRFELRVSGDTARLSFLITDTFREALKASGMGAPQPITFKRIEP
jgi:DNA polymerase III alpha subunit